MLYPCGSFTPTSINATYEKEDLYKVFPNPFDAYLNVETAASNEARTAELYNMLGEMVTSYALSNDQEMISTASLKPGLYILLLKNKQHETVQKSKVIKKQ